MGDVTTSMKKTSFADVIKTGSKIKISRDIFYELYIRNGDIRSCVRDIAKRTGFKGLYVEKDVEVIERKDVVDLFKLPTFLDFKVELFKHFMIGGEVFIIPVSRMSDKQTVGFRFLDPRTMIKYYSKKTWEIVKYVQRMPWFDDITYTADELSYFQFEKNPNNELEGLSLLEGVVYDALTDRESIERNLMFFENGMMPDGLIVLDDTFDSDEQLIAKQKLEADFQGSANSHKMIITNAVKDIKPLSVSSKDIDFINQRKLTIEKVCSVFQVPRSILGYSEGVIKSNGETNYSSYVQGTIRPYEAHLEFILNTIYGKFVSDDLELGGMKIRLDGENIDDRKMIEEWQRADIEKGISTIDEVRNERGKLPYNLKGYSDVPLVTTSLVVLGQSAPDSQKSLQK